MSLQIGEGVKRNLWKDDMVCVKKDADTVDENLPRNQMKLTQIL